MDEKGISLFTNKDEMRIIHFYTYSYDSDNINYKDDVFKICDDLITLSCNGDELCLNSFYADVTYINDMKDAKKKIKHCMKNIDDFKAMNNMLKKSYIEYQKVLNKIQKRLSY